MWTKCINFARSNRGQLYKFHCIGVQFYKMLTFFGMGWYIPFGYWIYDYFFLDPWIMSEILRKIWKGLLCSYVSFFSGNNFIEGWIKVLPTIWIWFWALKNNLTPALDICVTKDWSFAPEEDEILPKSQNVRWKVNGEVLSWDVDLLMSETSLTRVYSKERFLCN